MTKIDFYVLPENNIEHRHLFACRLAEKAYQLGHPVYLHSADNDQAHALNELLWSWRSSSFIPHQIELTNNDPLAQQGIVQIGCGDNNHFQGSHNGLLINLSEKVPEFFSRYERVAEIVVQDVTITNRTRANYRFYRDRGYPLETHNLRK